MLQLKRFKNDFKSEREAKTKRSEHSVLGTWKVEHGLAGTFSTSNKYHMIGCIYTDQRGWIKSDQRGLLQQSFIVQNTVLVYKITTNHGPARLHDGRDVDMLVLNDGGWMRSDLRRVATTQNVEYSDSKRL
jgi:hypothetical protein